MKHLKLGIIVFILTVLVSGVAHACYVPPQEIKCDEGYHVVENECVQDEVEVTPTPEEPTPTEAPKNEIKGDDRGDYHPSAVQAPQAPTCNIPFEKPRVWYTKVNGKVVFNWATDAKDIQKFSIVFGYKEDKLDMGVDGISSTTRSIEVNGLTKSPVYFQVWAWSHSCAEKSLIIDP